MSRKSQQITALTTPRPDGDLDPHYVGFFECFNQQRFFEAHEVLEALWLTERGKPRDRFYKGLIQLAGAFVHVQKKRWQPAGALFRLARANLAVYSPVRERLEVTTVIELINEWLRLLENPGADSGPVALTPGPAIHLQSIPSPADCTRAK